MTRAIRYTVVSVRDLLISAGPVAALAIGLLVVAYLWLDPNPPKTVRLATGPAQSAYDEFGKRYQAELAKNGIKVILVPSGGSTSNERLLRQNKADLGFVQGGTSGTDNATPAEGLQSLGSLFLEPVWLFYREDAAKKRVPDGTISSLTQLQGMRVNVGSPGSGVPVLMQRLFEANRIDPSTMTLLQLRQTPAVTGFLNGELDALVFASAPESLMVQMLLQTPGVKLMDFAQNEAYSRRFGFLSPVVLPRGIVDLAQDIPPQPVRLDATTTALLTRDSTHPALVELFAIAARKIHSPAGWFNRARAFPNLDQSEYPISREAERVLQGNMPFLQRFLPFWLANLVERMWLALGIIVAVLLPLSRIVPPLYTFRIRSRVFRWYAQLRAIEERGAAEPGSVPELLHELDAVERRAARVNVPLSYADELYALRNNINLVRSRLRAHDHATAPVPAPAPATA
jgi:hypothetical protein